MYPPVFAREDEGTPLALGAYELPVLPEAAATILAETSKEGWSAPRVVAALARDPSLAAHLLRIANSPAFAGTVPVVSIQQAVTRLGGAQLRQLAVVIACETKAFTAPAFASEVRAVFRHSLTAGLYAKEIARHRRANVEEAFLAALLHDIGWPVVIESLATAGAASRDRILSTAFALHAQLGAAVARAWKLPEAVSRAIEAHHDDGGADPLTATVRLADQLACRAAANGDDAHDVNPQMAQVLNLYPDTVQGLIEKGPQLWAEAGRW